MNISKRLSLLPLIASASLAGQAVHAQQAPTPADKAAAARADAEQNRQMQQQRDVQQREATVAAPSVRSTVPAREGWPALPTETPCFRIDTFALDVPATVPEAVRSQGASALPQDRFAFAREWLDHFQGQCVGPKGLDVLTKGLQAEILSRGYITTRVMLPMQDLSTGTLKLALVPGVVHRLKFADESTHGTWKTAFPARDGDVLQLRDLEQGLEQMKRVPNQDTTMQIVPGDAPGESDVAITVKRSKPWSLAVWADNSGTNETGRYIGNVTLGLYNLLGLNDILSAGYNQDLQFGNHDLGTHGWNASYSVPWGYWTGTLYGYTNTYYQQIAAVNGTFLASGNAQTAGLKLERIFHRSQNDLSGVEFQLIKRFGASFIEGTEIPQQQRNNTFIEAGLINRHYFGAAQFDGTLAYRQGSGWLGAQPDTPGRPTYRFHMATLDANLSVPFQAAGQLLRYVGTVHGQFTNDELNYIDDLTIGSRYTVRGFSGQTMLAAEKGFYWRNELQYPLGASGQVLYAGLDYGHLWGPWAANLAGTQLAGAAFGVKGSVPSRLGAYSYDVFAGTPIYKPAGFDAARVVLGFQATAQF
ncbi:ShlB/FhaC/HecB family hemolysin secretion/activation protein [Paraburkholderia youngii]|uniref:Hemolysin activation/secretion protein n=1 Tax=Paraburkholderia youngii TaxID=2782701 RepID=A0A7W8L2Y4_9BURK|nr:ShlB/FhaC/HecB family hemolysin secretion/activation protein [Paraburkholderia youngii]MBB5398321.1 hemolysin activation/secretion protein [Paraburkholderia youngii]